jgi:hypothetical protein
LICGETLPIARARDSLTVDPRALGRASEASGTTMRQAERREAYREALARA